MPLYPPCHLVVLSVLVFLTASCDKKEAIRDFIIKLDDSGEREKEFLSSLSAMEDAFSRLLIKQMRQTKLEEYFN